MARSFAEHGSQPGDKRRRTLLSGLSNPEPHEVRGLGVQESRPCVQLYYHYTAALSLDSTGRAFITGSCLCKACQTVSARRQPCSPSGNTAVAGDGRGGSMRLRPTGVVLQALHWLVVSECGGWREIAEWDVILFFSKKKKVTNNRLCYYYFFVRVLIYVWDTKDLSRKQNGWRSAEGVKEMYLSL